MKQEDPSGLTRRGDTVSFQLATDVESDNADEPKSLSASLAGDLKPESRQDEVIGEVAREVDRQDKCMARMHGRELIAASKQRAATLQILHRLLGRRGLQVEQLVDETLKSVAIEMLNTIHKTAIESGVHSEFMFVTRHACAPQLTELIEGARQEVREALKKGGN